MKKKILIFVGICLLGAYIVQYISINHKFPNPKTKTVYLGETSEINGFNITPQKTKMLNGDEIETILPISMIAVDEDGESYPKEGIRVFVMEILIENNQIYDKTIDFTSISAESGDWGNGINGLLFSYFNPNISVQKQTLKAGSALNVSLPFSMTDSMFKKNEWSKIDERIVWVVLSLYPQKNVLVGKAI